MNKLGNPPNMSLFSAGKYSTLQFPAANGDRKMIIPDGSWQKCKKCSLCSRQCPVGAITGVVGKEPFVIDQSKCIKCGMCMASCKFGAISKK